MGIPGGMYCAMVTPFLRGQIDDRAMERIVAGLSIHGFSGVLVAGSTGEGPLLSEDQLKRAVEIVAGAAGNDLFVVAGVGAPGVRQTLRNADVAAGAGAAAVLVVLPFYFSSGDVDTVTYYRMVAQESPLPILAYNLPRIAGQAISPEEVRVLSDMGNIAGYKDSAGNLTELHVVMDVVAPGFSVFQGLATLAFPSLCIGVHGVFSATSSMIPALDRALFRAYESEDFERCRRLQSLQIRLVRLLTASGCPIGLGLKKAMETRGLCGSETLYPTRASGVGIADRIGPVLDDIQRVLDSGNG